MIVFVRVLTTGDDRVLSLSPTSVDSTQPLRPLNPRVLLDPHDFSSVSYNPGQNPLCHLLHDFVSYLPSPSVKLNEVLKRSQENHLYKNLDL